MRDLRAAIRDADAVLVSTPEYNHSIPGALKNALDWVSRPAGQSALNGTPAAVIGASTGMFGAVWAQAEARKVLGALGGRVIEAELPVAAGAGDLRDGDRLELPPEQAERLEEILAELVAAAEERAGILTWRSLAAEDRGDQLGAFFVGALTGVGDGDALGPPEPADVEAAVSS